MGQFGVEMARSMREKVVRRNGVEKQDQDGYLLIQQPGGMSTLLAILPECLLKKASWTYNNTLQVGVIGDCYDANTIHQ